MNDTNIQINTLMDTVTYLQEQIKTLQAQMQNASPQAPTPQVMDVKITWLSDEGLFRFVFGDNKYVLDYNHLNSDVSVDDSCTSPEEAQFLVDESLTFSRWLDTRVTELIDIMDAALANVKFNVNIRHMLDECNESF